MSEEDIYCIVEEGLFADQQITAFFQRMVDVNQQWADFAAEHGCGSMYADNRLLGLQFDDPDAVPEGWSSPRGYPSNVYKPARRKPCMSAYTQLKSLDTKPSGMELAKMLGISPVFTGRSLRTPGFEKIGETKVLCLAKGSDIPEGVTQIKASEYWRMKEDEE